MTTIYFLISVAWLTGFLLSIYFFFYRLHLDRVWRWLGGIACGVLSGCVMALITFVIIWPPMLDFVTAAGVVLIAITISTLISSTDPREEAEQLAEFPVLVNVPEPKPTEYEI
ncbi:MAG TPA: hypothetical protein VNU93_09750 [Verrucomicrobiae bacterium]|nr:hypothetical protein [Verrucomicrobiae bacterium]